MGEFPSSRWSVWRRRGVLLAVLALAGGLGWAQPELMQLRGLSRDELLQRLGPPGSRATAGGREVLTFPQARVTLQEGVVIEVAPVAPGMARTAAPPVAAGVGSEIQPARLVARTEAAAPEATREKPPRRSPMVRLMTTAALLAAVAGGAVALRVWGRRRQAACRGAVAAAATPPEGEVAPVFAPQPARDRTVLDAALLDELEWKRFEQLVAAYFGARGLDARLTPPGADGSVDIHLHSGGAARPTALVQCKSWHSQEVGVRTVRELYGVMVAEGVMVAYLVTTGNFSETARAYAEGKKLHLMDGAALLAEFNALPEPERRRILAVVTEGDYTTPTCPSCDVKLVPRGESNSFWGCPRFPRCRYTMSARQRA